MLRRIGGGSYGSVWLARTATGVYRAVKVVWRDRFEDAAPYEREFRGLREFERVSLAESRQLALLHVGRRDEEGFFYYVMELADDVEKGREIDPETYRPFTLRELPKSASMTVERVVQLGIDMARGLAFLHHRNLVHRDIKPSNVILVNGVPKLADIGLVASSTMALTFVGTEGFVAPEGPGKPPADVYALGKVLYELATGMDRQRFPELPEGFADRTDRLAFLELNAVILRSCDPDLKSRYADAGVLLEDLLMIQAGKSVRRLRAAERGLQRALRWVALLAAVASVAGAGAWVAWSRAQQEMALRAEAEAERDALARRTQYAGLLAQASRAIGDREFGLARQMLGAAHDVMGSAKLGPEWHWLANASWGSVDAVVRPSGPGIVRMALTPVGEKLAIVDAAGKLSILNFHTWSEVAGWNGVADLAGWSRDGTVVLGTNRRGDPRAWSWQGGELRRWELSDIASDLSALAPMGVGREHAMVAVESRSPGRLVVLGFPERIDRSYPFGFDRENAGGWSLFRRAMSANAEWVAAAWVRGQGAAVEFLVTVMRTDGTGLRRFIPKVRPGVLSWSRGAYGRSQLELLDDASGEHGFFDPVEGVWALASDRLPIDSGAVWLTNDKGVLRAVGAELRDSRGKAPRTLTGHGGRVTQVIETSDPDCLVSGGQGGAVLRWTRGVRGTPRVLATTNAKDASLRFLMSSNGERVYLPGLEGIKIIDASNGDVLAKWPQVRWVGQRVDTGLLGIGLDGRAVLLVEEETGSFRELTEASEHEVMNLTATRDGRSLVYTRTDGSMWHRSSTGKSERIPLDSQQRWALQIDEDATTLWYTDRLFRVVRWDLRQNLETWSVKLPAAASHLARLVDKNVIVAAVTDGSLYVYDAHSGQELRVLPSGSASAEIVLANESAGRVFVGGNDRGVHVIDSEEWRHLATFRLPRKSAWWMLDATEDGTRLAGLTRDGELYIIAETARGQEGPGSPNRGWR